MPDRIQRRRKKGWRMPPNTVYVGHPTIWGNPFRDAEAFRAWLDQRPTETERVRRVISEMHQLRGKNLACWCCLCGDHQDGKPLGVKCAHCQPCHADVLLEILNG